MGSGTSSPANAGYIPGGVGFTSAGLKQRRKAKGGAGQTEGVSRGDAIAEEEHILHREPEKDVVPIARHSAMGDDDLRGHVNATPPTPTQLFGAGVGIEGCGELSPVLRSEDEEATVYAGEMASLNDGVLGYDPQVARRAAVGDELAQRAMLAADHALSIFRRDAPLVVTQAHLDEMAPETAVEDLDESGRCHVCQDEWQPCERRRRLPCGHEFHSACVSEWLTKNVGSCPVCRAVLQPSLTELETKAWGAAFDDAEALAAAEIAMSLGAITEDDAEGARAEGVSAEGASAVWGGGNVGDPLEMAAGVEAPTATVDAAEIARRARTMSDVVLEGLATPIQAQLYNHHLAVLCSDCRLPLPWEMRSMHLDPANQAWLAHRANLGRAQLGQRACC